MFTNKIYQKLSSETGKIAVLIDPEKTNSILQLENLVQKVENAKKIDYLFVGGSTVNQEDLKKVIHTLKELTSLPIVIFPGDYQQLSNEADALLYLSLVSGRNPEYLIGQHVKSAQEVLSLGIEIIPTAYILIDGGHPSTVAYVSQTTPIPHDSLSIAIDTAIAGVLQGKKAVYFDAGSGAKNSVRPELIRLLKNQMETVVIVGGGLRSKKQIQEMKAAGANLIVIGNKIEEDPDFLLELT